MALKVWGLAYHGLVDNGTLTLPDLSTMNYPQPSNGDCSVVKFPSTPAVNLTTQQKADLLAVGKEFFDYALLSGGHIAGVNINADFVYRSPNGERWAVVVALNFVSANMNNNLQGTLTFTQFGDFQLSSTFTPVSYTVSVDIASTGQTSPAIISRDLSETLTIGIVTLESFNRAGDECILRIDGAFQTALPEKTYAASPVGFIKLNISGDAGSFVVTPSVYADRATTLGTVSSTEVGSVHAIYGYGHTYGDWALATTSGLRELDDVSVKVATSASSSLSKTISNRLLAVQYDNSDALVDLIFDASSNYTSTYDPFSNSGAEISQTVNIASSFSATLTFGLQSISISGTGSNSGTGTFTGTGTAPNGGTAVNGVRSWTANYNVHGFSDSETGSFSAGFPSGSFNVNIFNEPSGLIGFVSTDTLGMFSHLESSYNVTIEGDNKLVGAAIQVKRWSRQLYGFGGGLTRYNTFPAQDNNYHTTDIVSPISKLTGFTETATEDPTPFATYHPISGQIIWLSATPVSYV